jgi:hypothetical protein
MRSRGMFAWNRNRQVAGTNVGNKVERRTWHCTGSLLDDKKRSWGGRNMDGDIAESFTHNRGRGSTSTCADKHPWLKKIVAVASILVAPQPARHIGNRESQEWQTIALFIRSGVHLLRIASELLATSSEWIYLMLRPLLRLFDEFSDAFGPVKSSPTSQNMQCG